MSAVLVAPVVIPLVTAIFTILAARSFFAQRLVTVVGMALLLLAAVRLLLFVSAETDRILVTQVGNWPAPFGITLVADLFAAIMVTLAGLMGFAVTLFSLVNIDRQRVAVAYYPLVSVLVMGVCGAFLTGDIFNLYVWFELLLIASFVMLGLGGARDQLQGTVKYVAVNLVASTMFLTALGVLYGTVGTLNMADIALQLPQVAQPGIVMALAMLFFVAFGIKSALVPLYFWLPASYHTPPGAVSGIFSGLLTKVGVYALIRVFTLLFNETSVDVSYTHGVVLMTAAALSMVVGVLGAVSQMEMRRILSFHIVSQIGYMVMGLAIFTPLALAGAVFYIIHHIVVKTNLFLIAGMTRWLRGTADLKKLGGLMNTNPVMAVLFLISALALAGIPPLSGFWAKLTLVGAGIQADLIPIVIVSLIVSLLTLFSMIKIWAYAFWGRAPAPEQRYYPRHYTRRYLWGHLLPIGLLALVTVGIGLSAEIIFQLSQAAADQLTDPSIYINAVLGP